MNRRNFSAVTKRWSFIYVIDVLSIGLSLPIMSHPKSCLRYIHLLTQGGKIAAHFQGSTTGVEDADRKHWAQYHRLQFIPKFLRCSAATSSQAECLGSWMLLGCFWVKSLQFISGENSGSFKILEAGEEVSMEELLSQIWYIRPAIPKVKVDVPTHHLFNLFVYCPNYIIRWEFSRLTQGRIPHRKWTCPQKRDHFKRIVYLPTIDFQVDFS